MDHVLDTLFGEEESPQRQVPATRPLNQLRKFAQKLLKDQPLTGKPPYAAPSPGFAPMPPTFAPRFQAQTLAVKMIPHLRGCITR